MPPHLAGREREYREFDRLLEQQTILENLVLTGLRGVGKTVLLDTFKPRAIKQGWLWAGTDLSESASVSEASLARRILADLAVITSTITVPATTPKGMGFGTAARKTTVPLSHGILVTMYDDTPGLVSDKIKAVLEFAWQYLSQQERHRVVFAYDEAQNLSDNASKEQFPLSVLLDVFQSIQKKGIPFMLVLTGLPTLFPGLVEARTYSERMFRVVTLGRLNEEESREAISKPVEEADCPIKFNAASVTTIVRESGGYPYFIQFICREVYDVFIQQIANEEYAEVPIEAIQRKLDSDFFAGRWAKVTDRQRQLLWVVATLEHADEEFTIQELVAQSVRKLAKPFSSSHANQMLGSLAEQGLIYKNRLGKYSFAVPLMGKFILRAYEPAIDVLRPA
ncbi:MAG: ATP-binding protein [Actinomycetota bacterium]